MNKVVRLMSEYPPLKFVYLTSPTRNRPTLNIQAHNGEFLRYALTRDQLHRLNNESADMLKKQEGSVIVKVIDLQHDMFENGKDVS